MKKAQAYKKLIEFLGEQKHIGLAYLFGSVANDPHLASNSAQKVSNYFHRKVFCIP